MKTPEQLGDEIVSALEARGIDPATIQVVSVKDETKGQYVTRVPLKVFADVSEVRTCSTCKHWQPIQMSSNGEYDDLPGEAEPLPGEERKQTGRCDQDYRTRGERPDANGLLLYSYESVQMVTGPDFGCVRHEPMEER